MMTPILFAAITVSEVCSISGQLFFKVAMNQTNKPEGERRSVAPILGAGVAVMGFGFFVWVGLMSKFDLSYLYPFEGLSRIMLVFAAWFFLREKMTLSLWIGVLLITIGMILVSMSGS